MSTISKLLYAWILMLVVSVPFPLMSLSAIPCTTHEIPSEGTTLPAITTEHTTRTEATWQNTSSCLAQTLLGSSCLLPAPIRGTDGLDDLATNPLNKNIAGVVDDALVHFGSEGYSVIKPGGGGQTFTFR